MQQRRPTTDEQQDLLLHERFLQNRPGGVRLNWSGRDLSGLRLSRRMLDEAILIGCNLDGCDFHRCSMYAVQLQGSSLREAGFSLCGMRQANLENANLFRAQLHQSFIGGGNLRNADLTRADLWDTRVRGADFTNAKLEKTELNHVRGNNPTIRSCEIDWYTCVWTRSPEGEITLRIGCQTHSLDSWLGFDDGRVSFMSCRAAYWKKQYGARLHRKIQKTPLQAWGSGPVENYEPTPARAPSRPVIRWIWYQIVKRCLHE